MTTKPKEKRTSISVMPSTKRELKRYGVFGESMDDLILRLLDKKKEKEKVEDLTYKEKIEDNLI